MVLFYVNSPLSISLQNVFDSESSVRWDMSRYRIVSFSNGTTILPYRRLRPATRQIVPNSGSYAFHDPANLPIGEWVQVEVRVLNGAGQTQTVRSKPFLVKQREFTKATENQN